MVFINIVTLFSPYIIFLSKINYNIKYIHVISCARGFAGSPLREDLEKKQEIFHKSCGQHFRRRCSDVL